MSNEAVTCHRAGCAIRNRGERRNSTEVLQPWDLFNEIHLLMTNDDGRTPIYCGLWSDLREFISTTCQSTQGNILLSTLGYQPWLLRDLGAKARKLAQAIQPHLVRVYGVGFQSFLAYQMFRHLGIPYVVSLHGNSDVDYSRGRLARDWRESCWSLHPEIRSPVFARRCACHAGVLTDCSLSEKYQRDPVRNHLQCGRASALCQERAMTLRNGPNDRYLRRQAAVHAEGPAADHSGRISVAECSSSFDRIRRSSRRSHALD